MGRGAWWTAVHGVTKSQTRLSNFTFTHWRRKWQPTPVFLPGESQGWQSLLDCCLWGHKESDTTEATSQQQQQGYNLEEDMATHPSILVWEIPWTEQPDGLCPWDHKSQT